MSADLPANRVHLVLAGLPQRNAEPLAVNICAALQFAANTFPEFQAFAQTDLGADGFPDGFRSALADLTPEFLAQIADMVTAGVVADKSGSDVPPPAPVPDERVPISDECTARGAYPGASGSGEGLYCWLKKHHTDPWHYDTVDQLRWMVTADGSVLTRPHEADA